MGPLPAVFTSVAVIALALLWRQVHETVPAAFLLTFLALNSTLVGAGLLVTEIVRRAGAGRRRQRVEELLAVSRR